MKILILNGSPRKNGNTAAMTDAFAEGARESGHEVAIIPVGQKRIAGCLGCEYCHTRGNGMCIQKDDEEEVYEALIDAEMLVLASPIYYFTFSAQLQAALHRTYAVGIPGKVRQTALLLSSGSPDVYEPAIQQYLSSVVQFYGVKDAGVYTTNEMTKKIAEHLDDIRAFGRGIPL